ncbi:STAS domain-containing protein [bacterium]|nr:STAS domain-containing protein [bacterium]
MRIKKIKKDGILILELTGEVNIDTASVLRLACEEAYNHGTKKLVLDFAEVTFIDSVGLALMIEMLQWFGQSGGALVLVNVEDKIRYLFELSKIDMLMSTFKCQEDAVASF